MKNIILIIMILLFFGCTNEDEWFLVYESPENNVRVYISPGSDYELYEETINVFGDKIDRIEEGPTSKCRTKGGCQDEL